MNLALTKLNELLRFPPTSIAICIFIFITVMSLAKSCENSGDNAGGGGYDVTTSAQMGGGLGAQKSKHFNVIIDSCFWDKVMYRDTSFYEDGDAHRISRNRFNEQIFHFSHTIDTAYRTCKDFGLVDTTKKPIPQQKIVYHNYELKGSDTLFSILLSQVQSPQDVTPRQLNLLIKWLQTSIRQDTVVKN